MESKPVKQKKCKACAERFTPARPMQSACSIPCAMKLAEGKRQAADRKDTRERKEKLKRRKDVEKEAQAAFNAFIRARDRLLPCISCQRHHKGQFHAGHFRSVGSTPELRFDERNVHKQCAPCNNHLSGNILLYRRGLLDRFGLAFVEWLEGPHQTAHRSREDLEQIKKDYRKKLRDIEKQ
jgi:Bacteriophage Lambda NinG protein